MCTDDFLVMDIQAGNKTALGKLVERHKKFAFRTALGLVGNKDDAYDISQEAFLRVYRSADTFKEGQPFLPWFYAIIANLSRTWLRRRSRARARSVNVDDVPFLLVAESNPEKEILREEMVSRLQAALQQLSFADREIITLQHFRQMSYDEIAEMLDIPRGTVMSRLYYARKRLAALLKDYDG